MTMEVWDDFNLFFSETHIDIGDDRGVREVWVFLIVFNSPEINHFKKDPVSICQDLLTGTSGKLGAKCARYREGSPDMTKPRSHVLNENQRFTI
jgi:hypothetical protein